MNMIQSLNRKISIAPMMNWTDRHERYFLRLLSPHALLYTEMVSTNALLYGDPERLLAYHAFEHPVALQLGGSHPDHLAHCARLGEASGYDEINLNVGCPSDRVKAGQFGACLMLNPNLVADCIAAMCHAVRIPVTVKCRIGVDQHDSYEELAHFIATVHQAGCHIFIIHARKAWLNGLSPKQNREIPLLRYDVVHQIKRQFPMLTIVLNGGLSCVDEIENQLKYVDGVMIGREAYSNPYFLTAIEERIFALSQADSRARHQVIEELIPYIEQQLENNVKLSNMTRHILGLYQGQKGAKMWRRYLSENTHQPNAGVNVIKEALQHV